MKGIQILTEKNKKEVKGFSSFLNNQIDFTLLITILLLLSIGLIMVLSASAPSSLQKYGMTCTEK